jgi:hypothetical protein
MGVKDFKEYYRKHWKQARKAHQEYFSRMYTKRAAWLQILKDQPCADCKGEFPPECMDFHHVKKKKFVVSRGIYHKSVAAIKAEIARCILICANCHRIRTAVDKRAAAEKRAKEKYGQTSQ